jgi:hypothetical protein
LSRLSIRVPSSSVKSLMALIGSTTTYRGWRR